MITDRVNLQLREVWMMLDAYVRKEQELNANRHCEGLVSKWCDCLEIEAFWEFVGRLAVPQ